MERVTTNGVQSDTCNKGTMYTYITTQSTLPAIAADLAGSEVISLDLETLGFDPHSCKIRLLSLNTENGVYVVDAFRVDITPLIEALRTTKALIVGQNLKFDQKFLLHHHGLELPRVFDTYRASSLIYNGVEKKHDLWSLYKRELDIDPTVEDLGGEGWSAPELSQSQLDYAADDVTKLPLLRDKLRAKLISNGLVRIAKIEFDAILPEAAMELNGFYLDRDRWLELATSNESTARRYESRLLAALPHPDGQMTLPGMCANFNLQSPQQLLKSLMRMGMYISDTNERTLAMQLDDWPIVADILEYREYAQCVKSFGPDYLNRINPVTGRVHTSFYPFTGAGRYASSTPNLQQVPRKKAFRECFRAAPGKVLVIADYSQVELRIAAEMAGDSTMIAAYARGDDVHALTASLVSDVPLDQVTKSQRQMAKAVNFGLVYGMAAPKLQVYAKANYGVTMSLTEAETFRDRYFDSYAGIARWHRRIFSDSNREKCTTRTIGGRTRRLKVDAYNEHANSPVQGTGADGLKAALRLVYNKTKSYAKLVHMVHDEIVLETAPECAEQAQTDLEAGMVAGMQQFLERVPVVVEGGVGASWAEK